MEQKDFQCIKDIQIHLSLLENMKHQEIKKRQKTQC